ncbi:MAG TPA: AI-2E family transporter, partial [Tepidisphaeraceae bacterium]
MPWVEPIARRAAWVTIAAAIIAFLWVGKEFVFPMALAVLLAFALSPIVRWLHTRIHSRIGAVVLACGVGLTVLVGVGAAAGFQFLDFAENLPHYRTELSR